jgi:hypothetical protein
MQLQPFDTTEDAADQSAGELGDDYTGEVFSSAYII